MEDAKITLIKGLIAKKIDSCFDEQVQVYDTKSTVDHDKDQMPLVNVSSDHPEEIEHSEVPGVYEHRALISVDIYHKLESIDASDMLIEKITSSLHDDSNLSHMVTSVLLSRRTAQNHFGHKEIRVVQLDIEVTYQSSRHQEAYPNIPENARMVLRSPNDE